MLEWLKLRHWIVWSRGHLQCRHLHTRFHLNPPICSKVIKGFLWNHLISLNVRHFGMAEAMRLKVWYSGHLQWNQLPTKFHESPSIGSKVISGRHTDRQAGDLISLRLIKWHFVHPFGLALDIESVGWNMQTRAVIRCACWNYKTTAPLPEPENSVPQHQSPSLDTVSDQFSQAVILTAFFAKIYRNMFLPPNSPVGVFTNMFPHQNSLRITCLPFPSTFPANTRFILHYSDNTRQFVYISKFLIM
jgi:hypothetical protein